MTGICLVAGLLIAQFGDDITLRWTHSIQKTVWEEDYRREGDVLRLFAARVRGTGAGMEPPADARLKDGAWHYVPKLTPLPSIVLTHSPHVPAYVVCSAGRCQSVESWLPGLPAHATLTLRSCP
jgi:hypothetical protein